MNSYSKLESAASEFLENCSQESFTVEDPALESLIPENLSGNEREKELEKLENVFDSFETVGRRHSDETFYVLQNFFHGTVFLCKPRKFELEEGILIPGIRFEPFHPAELYPNELEIDLNGRRAGTREYHAEYGQVSDLFFLLGPAGTMDMLTAESQANYEHLRDGNGLRSDLPLELEVFDFAEFYRETDFREGDFLKFEILSWADGKFRASVLRRPDSPSPAELKQWLESFEDALSKVCSEYRDSFEIPEQIEYAYLYAAANRRTDLRKKCGIPIDLYHESMRDISFRRDDAEWTFCSADDFDEPEDGVDGACECGEHHHDIDEDGACECGEHHHDIDEDGACECGEHHHHHNDRSGELTPDDFSVSKGSLDSLEDILKDVHAPVHEIELHAMMLDSLANSAESYDEFARVYEEYVNLPFADQAQEAAFRNYAEDLWELTAEHYGFNQDARKAPLRSSLLELTKKRIDLCKTILESGRELPGELRSELRRIHGDVLHTLGILGLDAVPDAADFDDLELRIGDIEDDFEVLSDRILDWLEKGK